MRVVHVDLGREMRGGQWQVLYLLETLGGGHALLARKGSPLLEVARERGIDAQPFSAARLLRLSRSADLLHAHDARSHSIACIASCAPVVVSRRVAFPIGSGPLSRWKYGRAAHFIAISRYVAEVLRRGGVGAERISVIYDGVRVPAAASSGGGVVAPATADPMKGSDLVEQASREGHFEVRFSNDLERDLPGASVFLYLTRSEGLGSAALLAMAHGVPVVASAVGGLPEIVQDGVTGILVQNETLEIAKAVRKAQSCREELGGNGRRLAMERFTTDTMADNTRRVYERVMHC